jgi:hypothetical protein
METKSSLSVASITVRAGLRMKQSVTVVMVVLMSMLYALICQAQILGTGQLTARRSHTATLLQDGKIRSWAATPQVVSLVTRKFSIRLRSHLPISLRIRLPYAPITPRLCWPTVASLSSEASTATAHWLPLSSISL